MKSKLALLFSIVILFSFLFAAWGCAPAEDVVEEPAEDEEPAAELPDEDIFIVIAAGSPGGVYFPLGAGLAYVFERRIPGVTAMSETTGASVENSRLVARGESEMGMVMANVAWDAYVGEGAFEDDGELPVRTLFSMYPAQQHLITLANSGIETIEDLVGMTVSVDAPGSGAEVTSYIILEAAGILDQVNTVNYSQPEAAEALLDGQVDAVFYNFASPAAVVEQIVASRDAHFVPVEADLIDTILAEYPYFSPGFIPAGHYGLTEDVSALTVGNLMLVNEDMDEQLAYDLLTAIFHEDSLAELVGIHPIASNFQVVLASEAPVPFHPGAERFFGEQ
ncbi:MAG: TAXI family TRAP transporter solute-binding subunit [Bacillota bacterium]|nr:TAXI family TRAP transporter solute-binding subunit [Bacillota bacterium]MDW7728890.1 TAXI family TRAP transporter solute-binding subunit [Bacillota bacterium]